MTSKPFMSDYGSTEITQQYITSSTDSAEEDQHLVTYSVPRLAAEDFLTPYQDVTGTPSTESFYSPQNFPTAKAPPRQFRIQQFPPQPPQVIDVEEFDETGIGKGLLYSLATSNMDRLQKRRVKGIELRKK